LHSGAIVLYYEKKSWMGVAGNGTLWKGIAFSHAVGDRKRPGFSPLGFKGGS